MSRTEARTGALPTLAAACILSLLAASTAAAAGGLLPQTRLRLTVVEWVPTEGKYQRLEAISGEYTVSADRSISVPVLGSIDVASDGVDRLSQTVADRLQKAMGLLTRPEASVEIVEFPPIYVTGDVGHPGSYPYRPGMTVLQAVAVSGGNVRSQTQSGEADQLKLVSELNALDDKLFRTEVRIARLQAELSGQDEIVLPDAIRKAAVTSTAKQTIEQERVLFEARANAAHRQTEALDGLTSLFNAEIDVLQAKVEAIDADLATREKELANVETLVKKGLATTARKSDLQRVVSDLRTNRLDQLTAIMRARQGISGAERSRLSIMDDRRTGVAAELQDQQAQLFQQQMDKQLAQSLLGYTSAKIADAQASEALQPHLTFTIVRNDGKVSEMPATETTQLQPGDVVEVALSLERPEAPAARLEGSLARGPAVSTADVPTARSPGS